MSSPSTTFLSGSLTAGELCDLGVTPISVFDANGIEIERQIKTFDIETGLVSSYILIDGHPVERDDWTLGDMKMRMERFPAPLSWRYCYKKAKDWIYWDNGQGTSTGELVSEEL